MKQLSQQVVSSLHAQGGRMTAQRRLILDALECMQGHPTVEDIHAFVQEQDPSVNLSTVYRTLNWLEDKGWISAQWFDEKRHKHRFDPAHAEDHYHFHCQECHGIIEFPEPMVALIKAAFEQNSGAMVTHASLVLTGVCESCRASARKQAQEQK